MSIQIFFIFYFSLIELVKNAENLTIYGVFFKLSCIQREYQTAQHTLPPLGDVKCSSEFSESQPEEHRQHNLLTFHVFIFSEQTHLLNTQTHIMKSRKSGRQKITESVALILTWLCVCSKHVTSISLDGRFNPMMFPCGGKKMLPGNRKKKFVSCLICWNDTSFARNYMVVII